MQLVFPFCDVAEDSVCIQFCFNVESRLSIIEELKEALEFLEKQLNVLRDVEMDYLSDKRRKIRVKRETNYQIE